MFTFNRDRPNNASAVVVLRGISHWYSYARAEGLQFLFPVYNSFCVKSLVLLRTFYVTYNIASLSHLIIAYNSRNREGNKKYFGFGSLRCSPADGADLRSRRRTTRSISVLHTCVVRRAVCNDVDITCFKLLTTGGVSH